MICLPQQGDTHLPPLGLIWKALIYKLVIIDSLIPTMASRMSSAQMHVPQSNFDNKQDGTLCSCVHIEYAETENKTRSTFCYF